MYSDDLLKMMEQNTLTDILNTALVMILITLTILCLYKTDRLEQRFKEQEEITEEIAPETITVRQKAEIKAAARASEIERAAAERKIRLQTVTITHLMIKYHK